MDVGRYVKGGIWWYNFPKTYTRGIIEGKHPCIIVSHVSNPASACTVLVAPISHMSKRAESGPQSVEGMFGVEIQLPGRDLSYVCCNQITPVVTNNLRDYVGQATGRIIATVDNMIMKYLLISNRTTYNTSISFEEASLNNLDFSELLSNPAMNFQDCRKPEKKDTSISDHSKPTSPKKGHGRSKPVYCLETHEKFESAKAAAAKFKVSSQTIMNSIKFDRPTQDGYQFRHVI